MTGGGNGERALVGVRRKQAGRVVREHVRIRRCHRESEGEETGGGDRGKPFESVRGEIKRKRAEEETGAAEAGGAVPDMADLMKNMMGGFAARSERSKPPSHATIHRSRAPSAC